MFTSPKRERYDKTHPIHDTASDVTLYLDTDDVNPDDVTDERVQRIVFALNKEFYPRA